MEARDSVYGGRRANPFELRSDSDFSNVYIMKNTDERERAIKNWNKI